MAFDLSKGVSFGEPKPEIDEFNWGAFKFNLAVQERVIKQCLLVLINKNYQKINFGGLFIFFK
ncbi:hypothetical protein EXP09_05455 [Campylobacter jejuni]|nr:hypothetical protein [Campylobacter jejuni]PNL82769.1 hypothetical protein A6J92_005885 [Campylobacter jejuni subsp. jejuni]EAH4793184.1 hypothetical protein [Campylobacter jejuni]EAH5751659.1 hypothetical protein [Campylobacter jejuni]EAH6265048.1 hypothetical protein [Campylobacter jejuni]